jgi:excisionase family DNA binding protein
VTAPQEQLLTVPQVAELFQVTAQTIRNWIDHGTLPALRVGRAYRVRRADVDQLLERAGADSASLATRRDVWLPKTSRLPRRREAAPGPSVWEGAGALTPLPPRAQKPR